MESPRFQVVGGSEKVIPLRLPIKIVQGAGTVMTVKPVALQVSFV